MSGTASPGADVAAATATAVSAAMAARQAARENWDGAIPVVISLAPGDVAVAPYQVPRPLQAMLPRRGYLPFLVPKVVTCFESAVPPMAAQHGNVWFEYKGQPLRWHLPAGVLYDLHVTAPSHLDKSAAAAAAGAGAGAGAGGGAPARGSSRSAPQLPWRITAHFQSFPDTLLKLSDPEAMRWQYTNSLKHAALLQSGSGSAVMSLPKEKQLQMWQAIEAGSFDAFSEVNTVIQAASGGAEDESAASGQTQFVPVRWIMDSKPPRQRRLPAFQADGSATTVADGLRAVFPDLALRGGAASGGAAARATSDADARSMAGAGGGAPQETVLVAAGVPLDSDAPLVDVCACFAHPDNWCYVVVGGGCQDPASS